MQPATHEAKVLGLFAELLEYPHSRLAQTARSCGELIAADSAEAAALLDEFASFVDRTPYDTLEEIFTATFDLNASCHPYVGYHLFGEAYKRSVFMLELKDRFRRHDFDPGLELPDHVAVLLRFLSHCDDSEVSTEIARDGLLATLESMIVPEEEPVDDEAPPIFDVGDDYRRVLQALRLFLQARYGTPAELEPIPVPDSSRLVS
jgi:nitrate reductase delta subunit